MAEAARLHHSAGATPEHASLEQTQWKAEIGRCLAEPSALRGELRFYEMTQRVDVRDFPALMEALRAEKTDPGLRGELFEIWVERDLASARAWFDAQPADDQGWLGPRLVSVWGRMDSAALGSWISTLSGEERKNLVPMHDPVWRDLIGALADRNPAGALDLLATIPEADPYCHDAAMGALARRDPEEAARRTLAMPTGAAKSRSFEALIGGWFKTDPAAARTWIEQLDDPVLADWGRTLGAIASADAGNAEEFQKTLDSMPGDNRFLLFDMRASDLARQARDEAVAMAHRESDPKMRGAMMAVIARELGATDPARAVELWLAASAAFGPGLGSGDRLFFALAEKQGVPVALRFLDRLPSDQASALKDAAPSLANVAGWPAVADAVAQMPAGPHRAEWLRQAVEGLMRDGAMAEAQRLTARLPAGPDRDAAVRAMGSALFSENPEAGAATLLRLADGRTAFAGELQRWMKADAPEARRWITATAMLNAAEKAALLNAVADSR